MRPVLVCALLLAGIVLGIHFNSRSQTTHTTQPINITILSTGQGLDRAQIGRRPSVAAFQIDDTFLEHPKNTDGLWVALKPAGAKSFLAPRTFNLHHTPAHIADFLEMLDSIPDNTTIIMAVSRSVAFPDIPAIANARPLMDQAFSSLGANTLPHRRQAISWAYIGRKIKGTWFPLAESASPYRGVTLSYALTEESSRTPIRLIDTQPPARQRLHLLDYIGSATDLSPVPRFQAPLEPNDSNPDAIAYENPTNHTTRMLWNNVLVGSNAEITTKISAIHTTGTPESPRFEVLANNSVIASFTVRSTPDRVWYQFGGALSNTSPGKVAIELRATSPDHSALPTLLWAETVIESDRTP